MRLFIDLDQHAAVQDFAVSAPAPPPQFKSQDTIDFLIYFIQAGVVQDMGAGFALKFGMVKTGDPTNTILAYQTASTYLTDPAGNPYYQMQVVMNTSQMASAIGTNPSIACTIELRYQDALAEIIHTLNLAATVFQTILVETGVTPPGVSTGYPDASTIELLVHKDVASGYAGLNASAQLFGAQIPVDGQTIQILDGQIASAQILAETSASFVTPAANATVSVPLVSSTGLVIGQYVRLPVAGYYIVESVPDSTHAVLQNNGDPANVVSGTTIVTDTPLLPAQAAAGGGGTPGQNAFTTLSAGFTVPAVGATVSLNVGSTAWMGGAGYALFITGAGYYLVNSITDATHVVVTNSGSAANQPPGTTVTSGGTITSAGPQGAAGATGASLSAYDALTASFTQPAVSGTVAITISNTAWLSANQIIYVASGGYYQVATVVNATTLNVTNLNYPGNATAGATIASGSKVSPAGLQGPQGAGGAGLNAFTTLSANFTQPAINANVTINVGTTAWMGTGQGVFVQGGGYYAVASISDLTHAVLTNVGGSSNVAAGLTVVGSGTQTVAPAGTPGIAGTNAFTVTIAAFTVPTPNSTVTVTVGATGWMAQGQNLYLPGAGYYSVSTVTDATHVVLTNSGTSGNATAGNTIASGTAVSPAGAIGPAGPIGATGGIGEAPTDGQLYGRQSSAWAVVPSGGGGGPFDPRNGMWFYEDFQWGYSAVPSAALWNGVFTTGGSYAFSSSYGQDTTHKSQGIIELACGTTSGAGGALFNKGYSGIGQPGFILGLGAFDLAARIAIETSLPASGSGFFVRFGLAFQNANFGTTYPPGAAFSTVIMEWSPDSNSGLFRLGYSYSTGTITYTNGTGTPIADTYGWWELKISAAGVLTIYLNGTSCGSVTLPSNVMGVALLPLVWIGRTSGTTNMTVALDTMFCNYVYAR